MWVFPIPVSSASRSVPHYANLNMGTSLGELQLGPNMARGKIGKLRTSELKTKDAGLIADGGCLYLRTSVGQDGSSKSRLDFPFPIARQQSA